MDETQTLSPVGYVITHLPRLRGYAPELDLSIESMDYGTKLGLGARISPTLLHGALVSMWAPAPRSLLDRLLRRHPVRRLDGPELLAEAFKALLSLLAHHDRIVACQKPTANPSPASANPPASNPAA